MKFAFVEGSKLQPQPKLHGTGPLCDGDMIAKCGRVKVWHWAHKGKRHWDQWWENETEWHRNWKDEFPTDWQEVSQKDEETGENTSPMSKYHMAW